jgi:uncharacterized GH25 family protein
MFYIKTILILFGLVFLIISTSVNAHGVWVSDRRGSTQVVVGEGAEDTSYKASMLTSVKAFDKKYNAQKVEIVDMIDHVDLKFDKEKVSLFTINFDFGYWSNTVNGKWVNKPMDQVPNSTIGTKALKYGVVYIDEFIKPTFINSLELQLVPRVNPLTLKKGDSLSLQLFYKGKPMPQTDVIIDVINDVHNVVETDKNGWVTLKVQNNALNVIGVETEMPFKEKNSKATRKKYFTTVSFTLKP